MYASNFYIKLYSIYATNPTTAKLKWYNWKRDWPRVQTLWERQKVHESASKAKSEARREQELEFPSILIEMWADFNYPRARESRGESMRVSTVGGNFRSLLAKASCLAWFLVSCTSSLATTSSSIQPEAPLKERNSNSIYFPPFTCKILVCTTAELFSSSAGYLRRLTFLLGNKINVVW